MNIAYACAALAMVSILAGLFLMPPCWLKSPSKTHVFGRLTYLTVQSNFILFTYHALRIAYPDGRYADRAFPLAFASGAGLTLTYYGLDHFVAAKVAEDKLWMGKGWAWIPLGNHLEHGLALPVALLDARFGKHSGVTREDVYLWVGGYVLFYLCFTLLNKRLTGEWVYPIFDEAEAKHGKKWGFYKVAAPVAMGYLALGFVGKALADHQEAVELSANLV
mmetsp:Transcript_23953/g.71848  ORF Transcript_23953/g.71848 Transcript_23953/m.71848 type:complete len:220 (+) Transcript_23953:222-881(+)